MREIKFRLWDSKNNCWYEPTFEAYRGKVEEVMISPRGRLTMRTMTELVDESLFPDRFELMQYTGLHDKNGREVYEGDIVKYTSWHDGNPCETFSGEIVYCDYLNIASFCISLNTKTGDDLAGLPAMGVEILGNIYENPELMEARDES